jgi:hypothetical protein
VRASEHTRADSEDFKTREETRILHSREQAVQDEEVMCGQRQRSLQMRSVRSTLLVRFTGIMIFYYRELTSTAGHCGREASVLERENALALSMTCGVCKHATKSTMLDPCGHVFCHDCAKRVVDGRMICPLCRKLTQRIRQLYDLPGRT